MKQGKEKEPKPKHTPMMRQYLALKAQHPDMLLFYRMGVCLGLASFSLLCAMKKEGYFGVLR